MARPPLWRIVLVFLLATLFLATSLPLAALAQEPSRNDLDAGGRRLLPVIYNNYRPMPRPVLDEDTIVMTADSRQSLVRSVNDGATLTFDGSPAQIIALKPGEVIASEPCAAAPHGLLRMVSSVDTISGKTYVETAETTLEDAVIQGGCWFRKKVTPADAASITVCDGVSLASDLNHDDSFRFEVEDLVVYDRDKNPATTHDQICAKGSIDLEPTIDFELVVKRRKIESFHSILEIDEIAEIELGAEWDLLSVKYQHQIGEIHLYDLVMFVGGFPVVVRVTLPIYWHVDGKVTAGFVMSVTQHAEVRAGVRYVNGGWQPVASFDNQVAFEPPRPSLGVNVKTYVDPRLALMLYGVAGPWAAVRPFGEFDADVFDDPWWSLYVGLEAPVGVHVAVLGKTLADWETCVIQYRIVVAEAETSVPESNGESVDVALMVDSSESMRWNDPSDLRLDAVNVFVDAMENDDQVAVVDFDGDASVPWSLQPIGEDRWAVRAAIAGIDSWGVTDIGEGMSVGYQQLNSSTSTSPKAGVLLTDGDGGYTNEASLYATKGWRVYTIGLGSSPDATLLRGIATTTGGEYYALNNASQLISVYAKIQEAATGSSQLLDVTTHMVQGQTTNQPVRVAERQTNANFLANWEGSQVGMTLRSPSGRVLTPSSAWSDPHVYYSSGETHAIYRVTYPADGDWVVILYGADLPPQGEEVTASVWTRGEYSGLNSVWEAEAGLVQEPLMVVADSTASGGAFVRSDQSCYAQPGCGLAPFYMTVPSSGWYYLWTRARGANLNGDSFYFGIGDELIDSHQVNVSATNAWSWKLVGGQALHLEQGGHLLWFSAREAGACLDAVLLTDNASYRPTR